MTADEQQCDEVKPVCSNCRRRFVGIDKCSYGPAPSRRKTPRTLQKTYLGDPLSAITLHPPTMDQSGESRSLELFLMHHYTRHVAATMSPCGGPLDMWLDIIPRLSFASDLVLNPLLALAAMHLLAHASNDPRLSLAAARYLDRTLVGHRTAVPNFRGSHTEPLWLSAVMLANLCWLAGHEHREDEPYQLPTQFWLVRDNVARLFLHQSEQLRDLGYGWVGSEQVPLDLRTEDLAGPEQLQMRLIEDEMDDLWRGFNVAEEGPEREAAYSEARDYVLAVYRGFFSGYPTTLLRRFLGIFTIRCRPSLRTLLEGGDPLALTLLAYLLVLMEAEGTGTRWWMNGKGRYEVVRRSVLGMKSLMPVESHWAMRWPCRVLEGEFALGRGEHLIPDDDEDTPS